MYREKEGKWCKQGEGRSPARRAPKLEPKKQLIEIILLLLKKPSAIDISDFKKVGSHRFSYR